MHNATTETEQDQPGAKHTGGSNTRTPCPLVTFRSASTDESALILARHDATRVTPQPVRTQSYTLQFQSSAPP